MQIACDQSAPQSASLVVGDKDVGIPYTASYIELSTSGNDFEESRCLFKTSCMRHSVQIGGVPYQYLVITNKLGTAWKLRLIATEGGKTSSEIDFKVLFVTNKLF